MSYLGNEVRTQETAAGRISSDIADDIASVRGTLDETVWQSGAGDAFRDVLNSLLTDLSACQAEVDDLREALAHHATTVEAHEAVLGDIAQWPVDQAKKVAGAIGKAADDGLHAFERGITQLAGAR